MGALSDLYATATPTPSVVPISDGSGTLNDWVTSGMVNPMIQAEDLIVGGVAGTPTRLGVGYVGQVLTVGSGGYLDWETPSPGFTNPMTHAEDLIVGGVAGAPTRLPVGYVGQVLTVGSGGYLDWETPSPGVSPANPTGVVGLTAVNGVLATYMRSDAAPPIDQGIVPTWTGIHTFGNSTDSSSVTTGAVVVTGGVGIGKKLYVGDVINTGKASSVTGAVKLVGTTSGVVTFSVNDAAGTWTMKLPATAGSSGLVLSTDGAGNCSWVSQSGASDYLALQVFF